ncbi:MAG TPA: DUF4252 domain-containing protein, partial [Saprospiraceae bacterium]|nr:DUF4252 domain-containing protein [Saprospiraceae bacterium]
MKAISKIVVIFLFVFAAVAAKAQNDAISKYFNQYVNDNRFTVVYISPKMFDMFTKLDIAELAGEGDKDAQIALEVAKDLRGLRILTTKETPDKFYKEATQKIGTTGYESLMTVRSKEGENVQFFVKDNGGEIVHELLLFVGGGEFVMLSIEGNISLKKIGKLAKMMDVKGAKHLEELDKKQK